MMARANSLSDNRAVARGFTLLEVLLALSLSGLVVGIIGPLAVQSLQTGRYVEANIAAGIRDRYLADALAADIAALLDGQLKLAIDANARPTLELVCLAQRPAGELHVALMPARVTYRLLRQDAVHLRLERAVHDLTKPGAAPTRETIARQLLSFGVSVLANGEWQALDTQLDVQPGTALAIRIDYETAWGAAPLVRTFLLSPQRPRRRHAEQ